MRVSIFLSSKVAKKDVIQSSMMRLVLWRLKHEALFLPNSFQKRSLRHQSYFDIAQKSYLTLAKEQAQLWHKQLCHPGFERLATIRNCSLVKVLTTKAKDFLRLQNEICNPCILKMMNNDFFSSSKMGAKNFWELIHIDVAGTMSRNCLRCSKYVINFVDNFLRYKKVVQIKHKDQI